MIHLQINLHLLTIFDPPKSMICEQPLLNGRRTYNKRVAPDLKHVDVALCLKGSDDDDVHNHLVISDLVSIRWILEVWILVKLYLKKTFRLVVLVTLKDWDMASSVPETKRGTAKTDKCYFYFLKKTVSLALGPRSYPSSLGSASTFTLAFFIELIFQKTDLGFSERNS